MVLAQTLPDRAVTLSGQPRQVGSDHITSDLFVCSQRLTVNHTVDLCPLRKFEGSLQSLRAISCLAMTVTVACTHEWMARLSWLGWLINYNWWWYWWWRDVMMRTSVWSQLVQLIFRQHQSCTMKAVRCLNMVQSMMKCGARSPMFSCCLGGRVCAEVTPDSWIGYSNTHVYGGVANSASDVTSCQSSCINDRSCTRVDWSPLAPAGNVISINYNWNYT